MEVYVKYNSDNSFIESMPPFLCFPDLCGHSCFITKCIETSNFPDEFLSIKNKYKFSLTETEVKK